MRRFISELQLQCTDWEHCCNVLSDEQATLKNQLSILSGQREELESQSSTLTSLNSVLKNES